MRLVIPDIKPMTISTSAQSLYGSASLTPNPAVDMYPRVHLGHRDTETQQGRARAEQKCPGARCQSFGSLSGELEDAGDFFQAEVEDFVDRLTKT
ncbi:hypothetical protein ACJ72_02082 [Emergomyces africanus]|uniref:Uncharacterized protein n=1 Tax=Emergomyces africanus TaxID=1955775 RepID=A0A1B7P3D7_9EURO|nr:hypothetical protein ACJ72_02082 [Emergomyces africanus]